MRCFAFCCSSAGKKISGFGVIVTLIRIFDCREWIMFLFNLPMVLWLFYEQQRQRRDSLGVYDPVDIHSRGLLKVHLRNCMIYLGYYFIMFFVGLYL